MLPRQLGQAGASPLNVADALARVPGALVLHRRRIPGSSVCIDHIAVTPSGVFVVDAAPVTGTVSVRDAGSFFRANRRLVVEGLDRSDLATQVRGQVAVVSAALAVSGFEVPMHGVLCLVGAEWGSLPRRPVVIDGITCAWPAALPRLLGGRSHPAMRPVEHVAAGLADLLAAA
jgi:hypothetical protein